MDESSAPPPNFVVWTAAFEGGVAVAAVAVGWLLGYPPLETFRASLGSLGLGALATLPMLGLLMLCIWLPFRPFSSVREIVDGMLTPMFAGCTVLEMAIVSLLAGLGEEMLFRGVFQPAAAGWASGFIQSDAAVQWGAAVAVAILFGLVHAINFSYAVLAGLIGLYLAWLWMATGNLAIPITAHAVYDFLTLLYLVKIRRVRRPATI